MKRFLLGILLYLGLLAPAGATISCSLPFTLTNGTLADATQVMANYNALVTCFTQAASAGANSDITSLNGLTTPITPAQGGTNVFIGGTSGGSANAQTVTTTTPNTFTLTAGLRVSFISGFTNTGATTLNVHGTGATNVFRYEPGGPLALTGGEIQVNNISEAIFDGTQFILLNPQSQFGGFNSAAALASAGTTDLGTVPSHFIRITGVTGITSFGSSADTNFPIYYIRCNCTATLTFNAVSMILPSTANINMVDGDFLVAEYLGSGNWRVLNYMRANGAALVNPTPLCGASNLLVQNNAGTPNTNIDYSADSAVLINPTGNIPIFLTTISGTINTTNGQVTSVVDAMDGESRPTSAWGYVFLISNGTTTGGLVSTSSASPTMPAGYTYRCLVGAMRYDASQNQFRIKQVGSHGTYVLQTSGNTMGINSNLVVFCVGGVGTYSATTPTWQAFTVAGNAGNLAPLQSASLDVMVLPGSYRGGAAAGSLQVAPSTNYGGYQAGNGNVPPFDNGSATVSTSITFPLLLEATTIQIACSNTSGNAVIVKGWYLKGVNAN